MFFFRFFHETVDYQIMMSIAHSSSCWIQTQSGADYPNRSPFGDARLYKIWNKLSDCIARSVSCVVNQISTTTAAAASYYRFLNNASVEHGELIRMSCGVKPVASAGKHLLILGDTTSFNLNRHMGRIQDPDRIGVLEDNKSSGFFSQVSLAVDAKRGDVLGVADLLFWNRDKVEKPVAAKGEKAAKRSPKIWEPLENRETYKWCLSAANAQKAIDDAGKLTFVYDQGADAYEVYHYLRWKLEVFFVIRMHYDRIVDWQGQKAHLHTCLSQSPLLGTYEIDLPALDHYSTTKAKQVLRKKRTAKMEVRSQFLQILPTPAAGDNTLRPVPVWVIEVREVTENLPPGEEPVLWYLGTNHPVTTFDEAKEIIHFYTQRWIIEQLFRTMKSEGFALEETELETFDAIIRQTILTFKAAATILQLVYARNRFDSPPIEQVFDPFEQQVLGKINQQFQGTTEKQKNPFPKNQLSWASWIIARLGGWKGYQTHKPPGPTTMLNGLEKFNVFLSAAQVFDVHFSNAEIN